MVLRHVQIRCPTTLRNTAPHESDLYILQLRALGSHTPVLVFLLSMHGSVGFVCEGLGVQIFLVALMLAHISSKKMCLYRHSTQHTN